MALHVRTLTEDCWEDWKNLRLEALKSHPSSFCSSFEEEANRSEEEFRATLIKNDVFGAFVEGELAGAVGFYIMSPAKMSHRGSLFGMYVKPEYRGMGVADAITNAVIEHARQRVVQLELGVTAPNKAGLKLYQRHGFTMYGTEPRGMKLGDEFHDVHLMVKMF